MLDRGPLFARDGYRYRGVACVWYQQVDGYDLVIADVASLLCDAPLHWSTSHSTSQDWFQSTVGFTVTEGNTQPMTTGEIVDDSASVW
jgi:hypothetical protein